MALIYCPECRRTISDKAPHCPGCGCPVVRRDTIKIRFPEAIAGQMFNLDCYVYHKGAVIAHGQVGETVEVYCPYPMEIEVVVKGGFGRPKITACPGDRFVVGYRFFAFTCVTKVGQVG